MRIFIVTLSPSPNIVEPLKFDRDHCLWLDSTGLEGICAALADQYDKWLLKFGAKQTDYQVRAVDMYGKPTAVITRSITRPGAE